MAADKPERHGRDKQDEPTPAEYHIAQLPQEDVEKLQRLEEELRADTGEDVVVVAYEKEPASGSSVSASTG